LAGYAEDGGACVDVDECASASTSNGCSPDAVCTNHPGTFSCACKPGYLGDGGTCANVAGSLSGLRWNLPCNPHGTAETACTCVDPEVVSTTLGGLPGASYDVTLRFRGVVEQKTYVGGSHDGGMWQVGGTVPNDSYNIYRLDISSPAQTFFLNRGTSAITRCWPIDYVETIRVAAGADVSLTAQVVDGQEIINRDATDGTGGAIVIPGVPPAPESFDGQFIQMDVVDLSAVQ
jgi:hypothetical protein